MSIFILSEMGRKYGLRVIACQRLGGALYAHCKLLDYISWVVVLLVYIGFFVIGVDGYLD